MEIVMKEKYCKFYEFAQSFLYEMMPREVRVEDLDEYYESKKKKTLCEIYESIVYNAQNYQSMPKVIKWKERYEKIREILYGFDYLRIKDIDANELYRQFRSEFGVTSEDKPNNSWLKWSKAIVDGNQWKISMSFCAVLIIIFTLEKRYRCLFKAKFTVLDLRSLVKP